MVWKARRSSRSQRRLRRRVLFVLLVLFVLDAIYIAYRSLPVYRVSPDSAEAAHIRPKIFIGSTIRNNEDLLRSHWNPALLNLARHFGPDNVYVSIFESGSWDNARDLLMELDGNLTELQVPHTITLDERDQISFVEQHPAETLPGYIWTKNNINQLRRIPFLAGFRNLVMEPLQTQKQAGITYDVVLWLNDVVFDTEDIITLLATRNGQYDSVCAQDFMTPSIYYDTFALRDSRGQKAHPQAWPYFLSSESRKAALKNEPIPVQSCWNGAIVMNADPFYATPSLKFRGVSDDLAVHHLEGSECCLIHADNHREANEGIWMNPNVRVAYRPKTYKAINPANGIWPGRFARVTGVWQNRLGRLFLPPKMAIEKKTVRKRVHAWMDEGASRNLQRHEAEMCLIDEMHVLVEGGWKHV